MKKDEAIRFTATIFKLQTLVDGGVRLTLDLQQPTALDSVMELMKAKQPGIVLECAAVTVKSCTDFDDSEKNETKEKAEGNGDSGGRRRITDRRNQ